MKRLACTLVLLLTSANVAAQDLDGYAAVMFDAVPNEDALELRTRVFAERRFDLGDHLRITAAGFAEGLIGERQTSSGHTAGIVRPQELHVEMSWSRADLRLGLSRVVWGRLDEFLPTDVVNPLDLARFFLDGRSEARMPVGMIRGRLLPSENFTLEGIYIPFFRRGRFDQLDERTSPFNLVPPLPVRSQQPARTLSNAQGGLRASVTTGRVDWAVSAFRGFEPFPVYRVEVPSIPVPNPTFGLVETFPRFTMVGGDFETVRGEWGVRGEVAVRDDRVEGGIGVDRRAGDYRVSGSVLVNDDDTDTDASFIVALDRSFARETRQLRVFGVYNPSDESAFARVILSFNLRDNLMLETSGGVFTGSADDAIGRLDTRDFAYARLKVFF